MAYLDGAGLSQVWKKAKDTFSTKDISVNEIKQMFSEGQGKDGLSLNYTFTKMTNTTKTRQRGIAYGNGYFVAVAASGKVEYSTDNGTTWVAVTPFTTGTLTGVAYGNGIFIVVDYDNKKIWSTDIPTNEWKNVYTFTDSSLEGCRYVNNEFVVVGTSGYIAKSNDAKNWSVVNSSGPTYYDIAYGNGKYLAVGAAGQTLYSINGKNWYTGTTIHTTDIRAVSYTNGTFVAGTSGGRIDWSSDGINWTQANNPSSLTIGWVRGFAYGDNRLYCALYASNGQGEVWLSEDKGRTWSVALTLTGTSRLWAICYGNDTFITAGESGILYSLSLGITWQEEHPNTKYVYYKLVVTQNDGSSTHSDVYLEKNNFVPLDEQGRAVLDKALILSDSEPMPNNNFGDADIDTIYYSQGVKITNADGGEEDDVYLYYPTKSGTLATLDDISTGGGSGIAKETIPAGTTTLNLYPNKYYVVDSQMATSVFTLLLENSSSSILNEYMLELRVDENPISIQFPSSVRWKGNANVIIEDSTSSDVNDVLTFAIKNTYLISIANNIALIVDIPNPELTVPVVTLDGSVLRWEVVPNADWYKVYNGDTALSEMVTSIYFDLANYITETGAYNIKVVAYSKYYTDSSTSISYTKTEQLATPTNLVISEAGVLSWNAVDNATSYTVVYYDALNGYTSLGTSTNNYIDLTTLLLTSGTTYTLSVKATSSNTLYTQSGYAEPITYTA